MNAVTPSTLVMFGFNHVFHAHWIKGGNGEWQFDCRGFVRGDERSLIDEIENFGAISALDRFVVVESQGDGRMLATPPRWERISGVLRVVLPVRSRTPRTDPSQLGSDLALGDDGDLVIENGDLAFVSGERNAIQQLSLAASMLFGAWVLDERVGSLCTLYFHKHREDLDLLGRLFRLEFARLATIPDDIASLDAPLSFVWRVDEVRIDASNLKEGRMPAMVTLEWADRTHWCGSVFINILAVDDLAKLPQRIRR